MPFEQRIPKQFMPASVRTYVPAVSGLYGISSAREWIFIGHSDNIQQSLLDHLTAQADWLARRGPQGFVFEVCEPSRRAARRDALVREYAPACNGLEAGAR
jgi:hypothetical protein